MLLQRAFIVNCLLFVGTRLLESRLSPPKFLIRTIWVLTSSTLLTLSCARNTVQPETTTRQFFFTSLSYCFPSRLFKKLKLRQKYANGQRPITCTLCRSNGQYPTLCTTVRLGWNSRPHDSACEMFVLCVWTVT